MGSFEADGGRPINQRIAFGFGAAKINAVSDIFWRFSAALPPRSTVMARLEAALARCSFTRRFGLLELAVKTINSSRF